MAVAAAGQVGPVGIGWREDSQRNQIKDKFAMLDVFSYARRCLETFLWLRLA
jgi:hypothetical protein